MIARHLARPASSLAVGLLVSAIAWAARAEAIQIEIRYTDPPGVGFNDPALGAARRQAFEFAAGIWARALNGPVPVVADARMPDLGGSSTGGTIGWAGPSTMAADFSGAPVAATWYPIALANQLAGVDLAPGTRDLSVNFEAAVDNPTFLGSVDWYYGTDGNPGPDIDFVEVALHELGHGLGFADSVSELTGRWGFGMPGIYDRNLVWAGVGQLAALTDAQRIAALTSDNLFWNGPSIVATQGGMAKIYAPFPAQDGSSTSHWDPSLPEILGPFYMGGANHDPGLALAAFLDMGWDVNLDDLPGPGTCTSAADCNDGDPCTTDTCQTGSGCAHAPIPGCGGGCTTDAGCSDGNVCNGRETCRNGACTAGTPLACNDGDACTIDGCNAVTGCAHRPAAGCEGCAVNADCNDGDACTADACRRTSAKSSARSCENVHIPGCGGCTTDADCGDGNACNGREICRSGVCSAGAPLACDDGDACTIDGCNATAGCTHTPAASCRSCATNAACNDGDRCTTDACNASGACSHALIPNCRACSVAADCDDGNACTADACKRSGGKTAGTRRCESVPIAGCTRPRSAGLITDDDGDQVADYADLCATTPPDELVDANGCSVCACTADWPSRGAYKKCVKAEIKRRQAVGGMPRAEQRAALKRAKASTCGRLSLTRCCGYSSGATEGGCKVMEWRRCEQQTTAFDRVQDLGSGSCQPNPCLD